MQKKDTFVLEILTIFGRDYVTIDPKYETSPLSKNAILLSSVKGDTLYVKIDNITDQIYFDISVQEKKSFYLKQIIKNTMYGISYGIMIAAIFYYLAFFLFNRESTYLFYSLTQFFMLCILFLVTLKSSSNGDELLFAHIFSAFIISTALFTISFLELRKYKSVYIVALILSSFILIIEAYTDFFVKLQIPTAELLLLFPIIAIIIYLKTGFKYILFYITGWGILIVSLLLIEVQIMFFQKNIISAETLLHITMPLESLIFALAISYKMKLEAIKEYEKEQMLIHYDKRASIGDMVDNIAHQWRQPLTHISYLMMNLSAAIANNKLDLKLWKKKYNDITSQLEYMSETITAFRDFYKPNKEKTHFKVDESIDKILIIMEPSLRLSEITLEIKKQYDLELFGNENELTQVLLNLLNNAKEAFESKNIKEKKITLSLLENKIYVDDNGGGLNPLIKTKIFDSYISTKASGSGVGLAMSKLIIEKKFQGKLYHEEISNGSRFVIEFPKDLSLLSHSI
ncbi:MAG TPA: hypothetical protein ENK66_06870 [Arcobacter sp.]|nr:hypothetical protein [Arcobacter sp.]